MDGAEGGTLLDVGLHWWLYGRRDLQKGEPRQLLSSVGDRLLHFLVNWASAKRIFVAKDLLWHNP